MSELPREFSDAVDAAAGDLVRLGVRRVDRVMVASENSVMLGALLFAASKLDAWASPPIRGCRRASST